MDKPTTKQQKLLSDALRWVHHTLLVIGAVSTIICGRFIYNEATRPGSAIMVGDLQNYKGK